MAAKRILMACALAMIFGSVGCQHWCERHYPCPAQAPAYASPACPPCYQQPVSYAPSPASWNQGAPVSRQMDCTCTPR